MELSSIFAACFCRQ